MRAMMVLAAIGLATMVPAEVMGQAQVMVTSSSGPIAGSPRTLSRERVERMSEAVGLDDVQLEIALELFKEVEAKRQALSDALREAMEDARELREDGDFTKMMARVKEVSAKHQEAVNQLEQTYLQDLQAMLLPEQQEAWPKAERIYRRGQHMGSLMRSQARVDVDELVRTEFATAYEREDVAEVLERWAVQVDSLLVERVRKAEDIGGGPGFQGGVFMIDGEDHFKPLRDIDGRIASAGEQAVRTLSGVLEEDAIEAAWLRRAFARVYRQTDGERRLEAALKIEDLTTDQREQLDAVAGQHERDAESARDRWVQAEKQREEDDTMPPGVVVMIEGQEPSPSELARKAVDELDERLEAKLEAILTPEQLATLPETSSSDDSMRFAPATGSQSIRIGG
ncbi:MAG: hypothetical protein ACIAQU_00715 [Phycisphaerales bacterium JB064]